MAGCQLLPSTLKNLKAECDDCYQGFQQAHSQSDALSVLPLFQNILTNICRSQQCVSYTRDLKYIFE
jgi:hypothetical protein